MASRSYDVIDPIVVAPRLSTTAGAMVLVGGAGPEPRAASSLGGICVVDHGVDTPWSVQAVIPEDGAFDPAMVRRAVEWCRLRGGSRGFRVIVSSAQVVLLEGCDLEADDRMEVYAMPARAAAALPDSPLPGLEIRNAVDRDELVAAYGGWMTDVPLARGLVRAEDMTRPDRRFLVAAVDGRLVGCALVWFAAGTACLSGIGIVPEARRRGYGRAITCAAARTAAGGGEGMQPDLVWMHATTEGAALYAAMGFSWVDTHLLLAPKAV